MIAALFLTLQVAAAPVAEQPPTPVAASPQVGPAEIRAAIDGGRLVQAELMLGAMPAAPSAMDLRLFGDLRLAQRRYAEAAQLFLRLEAKAPQDGHVASRLGMALLQLGRTDDAEARLRKAVALPNADWQSWNALGVLLDGRKAWIESRQAYAHAMSLAPDQPSVLNNAAYSLILQNHAGEARELLAKARSLAPDDERVLVNIQIADGMAGVYPKRKTGSQSKAQWAKQLNNSGYGALLAGDLPKARSLFARAIEASDVHFEAAERNLARVESLIRH